MIIDFQLIKKLESLSMISLSENESQKMIPELEKMIGMINKLNQINTDDIKPLIHVNMHEQTLREDTTGNMLDQNIALSNTKHAKGVYFTVPKVINKNI